MRNPSRLVELAQGIEITQVERIRPLRPPEPRPTWSSAGDTDRAREILVQRRTCSDAWKDPRTQKRRFLRSKSKNKTLANPEKWTFSQAERSSALDKHIRTLGPVAVAQALLDFDVQNEPLDTQENDWLEYVTGKQSLDYVTLLASYPTRQRAKNRALSIALSNGWMSIVEELLRYGANPNELEDAYFLPAVREGDFNLVDMLSSPNPLSEAAIDAGLLEAIKKGSSRMVAMLLAHGADANYAGGEALETAVLQRRIGDVAVICARSEKALERHTLDLAIAAACTIADYSEKLSKVEMLLCAGADANHVSVQDLLLKAVRRRWTSCVQLLVNHGTCPDRNEGECLQLAVKTARANLVEILLQGEVSLSSTSKALQLISDGATELEFHGFMLPLLDKGVSDEALSACLARVVAKHYHSLVGILVQRGASLNHNDAECVRFALREQNTVLLQGLLRAGCVASTLARALPDALSIRAVSVRRDAMRMLLKKGVSGRELHQSLCTVLGESLDSVDYELIGLLVRGGASVDFAGTGGNCIKIAARRRDLTAVQLLCQGNPSPDTVSSALPGLVSLLSPDTYSITFEILSTLLPHGAVGPPLAEALIHAVKRDHDGRTIDLLLEYGADVNYREGEAIRLALSTSDLRALQFICAKGSLAHESVAPLVPHVLDPSSFSMDKARLLLPCCRRFTGLLDRVLMLEVKSLGSRPEVIDLLLQLDASVDYADAAALTCAIQNEGMESTQRLLLQKPSARSLSLALQVVAEMRGSERRFDLMRLLLEHDSSGTTQNAILLHEVESTTGDDLRYLRLLLDHGALVDYEAGAPLLAAVRQRNIPIFDLLMSQGRPCPESIAYAFAVARSTRFASQDNLYVLSSLLGSCPQDAFGTQISQALIEAIHRDPSDLESPLLMLEHGASISYDGGLSIQRAATSSSLPLIQLLFKYQASISRAAVSAAFEQMIDSGSLGLEGGFQIAQTLLQYGVDQRCIDHAMRTVFSSGECVSVKDATLFLSHGADVNATNGTFFVQAARQNNMELFHVLVLHQPNYSIVIPAMIQSVDSEDTLDRFLQYLLENTPAVHSTPAPLTLFTAMERYPEGERLVRLLLQILNVPDCTRSVMLDSEIGFEDASALVWALAQESPRIHDSVILAIIEAGPKDISLITAKTRVSATMMSVWHKRPTILRALIQLHADVSSRDYKGLSPLFYASGNGDEESARLLMLAQASIDDGSLHEAAREGHAQLVSLVLAAGHDPAFPSLLHSEAGFGRTALEELCFKAMRGGEGDWTWENRIRDTVKVLLPLMPSEIEKPTGKSILHLALDNPRPVDVTKVLMDFPQIWRRINDPVHQYEDVTGLVYSPTKYVEHFHRGSRQDAESLKRILAGKRCQDRYYSRTGAQPEDAVGIPDAILAEIERKRLLDQEQKEQMERMEKLAAHQREIQRRNHEFEMTVSAERHKQSMRIDQEREDFQRRVRENRHQMTITHQQELDSGRQETLREENRLKIMFLEQESSQRQAAQEAEQEQQIAFKTRLRIEEQKAEKKRIEFQKELMLETDQTAEKQHSRQLRLLDRQDESVSRRASEMRMVADAARGTSMSGDRMLALEGLN